MWGKGRAKGLNLEQVPGEAQHQRRANLLELKIQDLKTLLGSQSVLRVAFAAAMVCSSLFGASACRRVPAEIAKEVSN